MHNRLPLLTMLTMILLSITAGTSAAQVEPWRKSVLRTDGGGWVTGIVVHPKEKNLRYVRTDVGGSYRWSEEEQKWISIFDWIPIEEFRNRQTDAIALDLNDPDKVYLAVGYHRPHGGIFRSDDRGVTFTRLNFPSPQSIHGNAGVHIRSVGERLEVSPFNSDELIYGLATGEVGLYKTTDNGDTWSRIPVAGGHTGVKLVFYDRHKEGHFYVALTGKGLYHTADGGNSFAKVNANATDVRRMAQATDGTLYFTNRIVNREHEGAVFRIKDGTCTNITNGITTVEKAGGGAHSTTSHVDKKGLQGITTNPFDPNHIVVQGALMAGHPVPTYESKDGGKTWDRFQITFGYLTPWGGEEEVMRPTVSDIAWDSFDENLIHHVDGGGAAQLHLNGNDMTAHSTAHGIEETVNFVHRSIPLGDKELWISGCADRAGYVHDRGIDLPPTSNLLLPDMPAKLQSIHAVNYAPTKPKRAYFAGRSNDSRKTGKVESYFYRSEDGGLTWKQTSGFPLTTGLSIAVSATNPDNVVVRGDKNVVSTDGGNSWQSVSGLGTLDNHNWVWCKTLVADPVDGSVFYAYHKKAFYRSTNGGKSFSKVSAAPHDAPLKRKGHKLVATPGIKGHLWMNFQDKGLYRSTDGGESWSEVPGFQGTESENGAMVVDVGVPPEGNSYPGAVFVGGLYNGEPGVWLSLDEAKTWKRINPDNQFFCFAANCEASNYKFGMVVIGGQGAGGWYLKAPDRNDYPVGIRNAYRPAAAGKPLVPANSNAWGVYNLRGQRVTGLRAAESGMRRGTSGASIYIQHNNGKARKASRVK